MVLELKIGYGYIVLLTEIMGFCCFILRIASKNHPACIAWI
jgi:hypothetical protein